MEAGDLAIDAVHVTLPDEVQRLLDECCGARVPKPSETGYDPQLWRRLGAESRVTGLAIPCWAGGAGRATLELSMVFLALGRCLARVPLLSCAGLAAPLLAGLPDDAVSAQLLPAIANGSAVATVALADTDGRWDDRVPSVHAFPEPDRWSLCGEKQFVLDAQQTTVILVGAQTPDGFAVFAVDREHPAVRDRLVVTTVEAFDRTRQFGEVRFEQTPARLVGQVGDGHLHLDRARDLACVYLAAEQAGGAERLLEIVVDHVKKRVQFGRLIGSFQAVKHRCAEMLLLVESAKSAALCSSVAAAAQPAEFSALANMAKAYCSDAYVSVAASAIQLLGGTGFAWDHAAHLYYRRALSDNQLFGDPHAHREWLVQRMGV